MITLERGWWDMFVQFWKQHSYLERVLGIVVLWILISVMVTDVMDVSSAGSHNKVFVCGGLVLVAVSATLNELLLWQERKSGQKEADRHE